MKQNVIAPEHHELLIEIGKRLRELRKDKGISYKELAQQIGISRNSYNQLELGIRNFQFITLLEVLKYYEIELADFFKDFKVNSVM